jgi:uncharacterized membrane protein
LATKTLTRCGAIAAMYVVLTVALAPISFGPVQFRVSEMLKPLALFHPAMGLAFGLGTAMANIMSPFGAWDYIVMAIVDIFAATICWFLRKYPYPSLIIQALVISAGVAIFPLGLGGGMPFWSTFPAVSASQLAILLVSYALIWGPRKDWICHVLN